MDSLPISGSKSASVTVFRFLVFHFLPFAGSFIPLIEQATQTVVLIRVPHSPHRCGFALWNLISSSFTSDAIVAGCILCFLAMRSTFSPFLACRRIVSCVSVAMRCLRNLLGMVHNSPRIFSFICSYSASVISPSSIFWLIGRNRKNAGFNSSRSKVLTIATASSPDRPSLR